MNARIGIMLGLLMFSALASAEEPASPPSTTPPAERSDADRKPDEKAQSVPAAEVAGWLNAVNNAEIDEAKLVMSRTDTASVKAFAQQMLSEHTVMLQKTQKYLESSGTKAADSKARADLQVAAKQDLSDLQGLTGAALDRKYAEFAVRGHQKVLDQIDAFLVSRVDAPEVRALLVEARPKVQAHLEHAKSLRSELEGNAPPQSGT
jgi:putative membrane protein